MQGKIISVVSSVMSPTSFSNHGARWLHFIDVTVRHSLTAPSLSTPTATEVTPTPISCEMMVEEKQAEGEHADAEDQRVALHEL